MSKIQTQPNLSPTPLFNPSLEEFVFKYNGTEEYILPAYGIETYPKWLADKMAATLADTIIAKRGVRKNHQLDKEELLDQIYVK